MSRMRSGRIPLPIPRDAVEFVSGLRQAKLARSHLVFAASLLLLFMRPALFYPGCLVFFNLFMHYALL